MQVVRADQVQPGDVILIARRFPMEVLGVKANDYGIEEGTTLYVRGSDGETATWYWPDGSLVEIRPREVA